MRHFILPFLTLFAILGWSCAAEDAETERTQGIVALKESQTNPRAIVVAARHFAKASDLFVTAGNDDKATEMNSFLFWCKKRMTYQDIEQFTKGADAAVGDKLFKAEKIKPEADESQAWFDRADKFATANPSEHLLIAVRFFEVASRFVGSKHSITAQERSLKEQALAQEKVPPSPPSVPSVATIPVKPVAADSNDPIAKRVAATQSAYVAELESAHKATLDSLAKREADARKIGNKKVVDEIKEERAAFESKKLFDQIQCFTPDQKRKIGAALKMYSVECDAAIKAYTKAAKDDDANAVEKQFKLASDDYSGAGSAPAVAKTGADPASAQGVLVDKTYVAWFTVSNLKLHGGAVISLDNPALQFDGMVFGEIHASKWMAGSEGYQRTQQDQNKYAVETSTPNMPIQLAITYRDRDITIYRNGIKYANWQIAGEPQKFGSDASALFGIRVSAASADCFAGSIVDARIYAEALNEAQLVALRPSLASGLKPWAWWTFEDGTCRDRMGRFAPGKPTGVASIKGGVMLLSGKGFFKADQVAAKKK
ncbi:MAG: LamG-like jellyroll fold domain-containing protein [Planctomycetota bacterium]